MVGPSNASIPKRLLFYASVSLGNLDYSISLEGLMALGQPNFRRKILYSTSLKK